LSDNLIEALGEELLADRADTVRSCAHNVKFFVQALLKVQNVGTRGGCSGNVTDPQLVVLDHLLGRQDLVQVILVTLFEPGSAFKGRLLATFASGLFADEG